MEQQVEKKHVYHYQEPAPPRFNVKLSKNVKGVLTWDITVLNAETPDHAIELLGDLYIKMEEIYGPEE